MTTDSLPILDSIGMDTVTIAASPDVVTSGVIMERPIMPNSLKFEPQGNGISWLLSGIILLFIIICFRYHKNSRYFSGMLDELMEVRVRHNAFDDTLRETSFMFLLNLLWCVCTGILIYDYLVSTPGSFYPPAAGMLICIATAAAYTIFMSIAYFVVGNVFSDTGRTSLWVKGYYSSQGLVSIVMFPLAMLAFVLPNYESALLIVAGIAFVATKIMFIYKGFRIFFTQSASWVLFLYYLCSLEIVPLILAYVAASYLCSLP